MPFEIKSTRFRTLIILQLLLLLFLLVKVGLDGYALWGKKEVNPPSGRSTKMVEKTGPGPRSPVGSPVGPDPELIKAYQSKAQILESRRLEVEQKEKDLLRIQKEIDGKINQLNQLQVQLKKIVGEAKAVQDKKVQHLSEIFSAMPPEKAARMVEKMDDRTVTEVIQSMRSKEVGGILAYLDPARAARISADLSRLTSSSN
jgi:hypothetical protein